MKHDFKCAGCGHTFGTFQVSKPYFGVSQKTTTQEPELMAQCNKCKLYFCIACMLGKKHSHTPTVQNA